MFSICAHTYVVHRGTSSEHQSLRYVNFHYVHTIYTLNTGYWGLLGCGDRGGWYLRSGISSRVCSGGNWCLDKDRWGCWQGPIVVLGFPGPSMPASCPFSISRIVWYTTELHTSSHLFRSFSWSVVVCL